MFEEEGRCLRGSNIVFSELITKQQLEEIAVQKPGETIDEYVVHLRQMAESYEFGMLKDSLIRDQIVLGTRDEGDRERLLRERPVPNLELLSSPYNTKRNDARPISRRVLGKQAKPRQQQRQSESSKWCGRKKTTHGQTAQRKTQSVTSARKKATLPRCASHPNASMQWIEMTALTTTIRWVKSAPTRKTSGHQM